MRKKIIFYLQNKPAGFSLMEALVSLFVIMILILGIYSLIILSLKLTADNKYYVEATAIADQQMEQIRNMPYDDVGTVAGTVNGPIPDNKIIVRDGTYNIHTVVAFVDDPYDGLAGSGDSVFTDYKIATIEVLWEGKFGPKNVTAFSKIIPRTEEVLAGYGLLKLLIMDSSGAPVPLADIHLENNVLGTPVSVDYNADASGKLTVPVLPGFEAWEVTVTKPSYGTDATYDRDVVNPNPSKTHLTIFNGLKTEDAFTIDYLSSLTINTVANSLPQNWQVNNPLNTRNHSVARLDQDSSNNIYTAWQSKTATSSHVYLQKFNAAGASQWLNDKKISTTQFQKNPDIATRNNGDSFVVWQDNSAMLKATAFSPFQRLAYQNFFLDLPLLDIYDSSPIKINQPIFDFDYHFLNIAQAATPAIIVQEKAQGPYYGNSTMSETFDSSPSAGNVLIIVAELRNPGCSFNTPTTGSGSFIETAYSNPNFGLDIGIWHRVAIASEDSTITITTNGACNVEGGVIVIYEVSGLDTSALVDQITINNQTSNNNTIAHTNSTGISTDNGFAIAAITFADDDFNTPTSANFSSISTNNWSHEFWLDWFTSGNYAADASLAIATMHINSAAAQRCTLSLSGGWDEQRNSVMAIFELSVPENGTLASSDSQINSIIIPASDIYLGGTFILTEDTSSRSITDITISEQGSINALNDLDNIRIYYDLDTSAPYDCASESYNAGLDPLFGVATNFNTDDGQATFSEAGGVIINTTQALCLYSVLDVLDTASAHDYIDIFINDPAIDIIADSGTILPSGSNVDLNGQTEIQLPAQLELSHYRWRDDDGSEISANWLESQDSPYTVSNNLVRLRFAISNEGSLDSASTQFRLEYAENTSTCGALATWTPLPTDSSQHWQIVDSSNFNDNDPTTNFAGSLSDPNSVFIASVVKDTSNLSPAIILKDTEFTEIEYSLKATTNANDSSYCFRLSNDGDASEFTYLVYPQIAITSDDNIYIKSLDSDGNEKWAVNKLNSDSGDASQSSPQIALTESGTTATTTIIWVDDRNGNRDIFGQSTDENGNDNWTSEIQFTSSANNEYNPDIIFDSNENIYITWEESAASRDIYLHKYDMNGLAIWGSPLAIANSSDDESNPKLAVDNSANIYVTWGQNETGTFNVYVAKYDSSGTELWKIKPNTDNLGDDQKIPSIFINNSDLLVVWDDDREGNSDLYSQKYDLNGNPQWTNDIRLNVNTGTSTQTSADVLINSLGDFYGTWSDFRNNQQGDIFATKFFETTALSSIGNIAINIKGTKKIGLNPVIYKFNLDDNTDAGGQLIIPVEWDSPGYTVELQAASIYTIIKREPLQPLLTPADSNLNITIYVE